MNSSSLFKCCMMAALLVTLSTISAFSQDLFAPPVDYAAGDGPTSVFSVDFNGDGNNDLATANFYDDNVSILLGNGDGTFQSAVNYATGSAPWSVFSIDFNGDNINDLATANGNSDNVSILLGNGDGTFQSAVNYAAGDYPRSVFS
ncbi:MAG: VCBS repeat-containing protein, partial [candidate division Zixibacteria bacterium]|nr:VCBS repeat-containing protein [candidate division Zixibacteria bacterium]